ncbi:PAS domain-containing protein [Oceaniglobus ichthyenteri]|uniref:PAS domain-containing protein n=1 Tax=Oceaniglobus ichthyenteri TaxID=2136177 RepID=UPI000D337573|nr:PAS domain-containing protein [Oceaniglobus ichthyenteri]
MSTTESSIGKVVSMFLRKPVETDCFAEVETYWKSLCDGRMMPLRAELDPRGIVGALDRTFLVERVAPGVARFRLAGNHLSDLMGMEVRGMPMTCFFQPGARAQIAEAVEAVFAEPARVDLWLSGPGRLGRGEMNGRMMLLPLRDDQGQVTRALGCLSASAPFGRAPNRFKITSDNRQTLVGYGRRPAGRAATLRPTVIDTLKAQTNRGETAQKPKLTLIDGGA